MRLEFSTWLARKQQTNVCTRQPYSRYAHSLRVSVFTAPPGAHICLECAYVLTPPVGHSGSLSTVNETCNKRQKTLYKKKSVHTFQFLPAHLNRVYTCSPHLRTLENVLFESLSAGHQFCLGNCAGLKIWLRVSPGCQMHLDKVTLKTCSLSLSTVPGIMSSIFFWNKKRVTGFPVLVMNSQLLFADSLTSTLLDWLGCATGLPVLARLHSHIQINAGVGVELILSCGNDVGSDVPDELDKEEVVDKPGTTIATGFTCKRRRKSACWTIHDRFSQTFFEAVLVRISLISAKTVLMCNDFFLIVHLRFWGIVPKLGEIFFYSAYRYSAISNLFERWGVDLDFSIILWSTSQIKAKFQEMIPWRPWEVLFHQGSLSCQILPHDSVLMIVSRFTSLNYDFVLCCDQVSQILLLEVWLHPVRLLHRVQIVLALLHFAISVFQEVSVNSFPVTSFLMAIQAVTGFPCLFVVL